MTEYSIFITCTSVVKTKLAHIIKIGQQKYRDWPKDRNTIYRALKSMSKCKFVSEKRRMQGQATLWSINKNQISDRDLMIHEIKQLQYVVSRLPHWAFKNEYFKYEIEIIWQRIRTAIIDIENQDITVNWILFNVKTEEIFTSKDFKPLDKQLSIIFVFCLCNPGWKLLNTWFNVSQIPYRVKADFKLMDICQRNFYPKKTKEQMFEKLEKYELDTRLSKRLRFLMMLYVDTKELDYKYTFKLFDKNNFPFIIDNKQDTYEEAVSKEEVMLFMQRSNRKNLLLDAMKKQDYSVDEIDQFIANYKRFLLPCNH